MSFTIQQEEQNSMMFLFNWEILHCLRTIFITWSLGCPNLACQRLTLLEEVTSEFETILEVLLIVVAEVGNSTFGTDADVDISIEGLPWSLRLWKE